MDIRYFPRLVTDRLLLRKLEVDDFPNLIRHANNPGIAKRIVNLPHPFGEMNAVNRMRHVVSGFKEDRHYAFVIALRDTDELVGEISLNRRGADGQGAELGYWIGEAHWGKGLASEAVGAILPYGFERLGLNHVYATCAADNEASQRVAAKNGFVERDSHGREVVFQLEASSFLSERES